MPKMQILCPQCKQPFVAEIQQLFDVARDPNAKTAILGGLFNVVQCPHCGYQGSYPTPIVYHDPDKELLLVFVPPELGLSQHDQEHFIGPLLQQIMRSLPPEKRKAYLLHPQQVLTLRSLQERILEADGITKEMLEAEERRVQLLQRLLSAPEDQLVDILRQEDATVDVRFFQALSQLIDAARTGDDEVSAQRLEKILELALEHTTAGREQRAVVTALQDLEKHLAALGPRPTPRQLHEALLTWLFADPREARIQALVALAWPLLDYSFFQALTERIEQIEDPERRQTLEKARDRLLELGQQLEKTFREAEKAVREAIERLSRAQDVRKAVQEALPWIDQDFLAILEAELDKARQAGDLEHVQRLQRLHDAIQEALAPPPEVQLLQRLLETPDPQARQKLLEEHADLVTPDFVQLVTQVVAQSEAGGVPELKHQLQTIYNEVVRFSMMHRLKQGLKGKPNAEGTGS